MDTIKYRTSSGLVNAGNPVEKSLRGRFDDIVNAENKEFKPFFKSIAIYDAKAQIKKINEHLEKYYKEYQAGDRINGFDRTFNLILNTMDDLGINTESFRFMFGVEFMYGGGDNAREKK